MYESLDDLNSISGSRLIVS